MNRKHFILTGLVAMSALIGGCDKLYVEDMSKCYAGVTVTLDVHPETYGAAQAAANVRHAVLYVFDSEGAFLERRETQVGKQELLWHPDAGELTVVGWLNKVDNYNVTGFTEGMKRTQGLVSVSPRTRAASDLAIPTDLFYGEVGLQNLSGVMGDEPESATVQARRKVGSMTVTVRSLQDWAGYYDNNYKVVVGPVASSVDFFGRQVAHEALHTPASSFNADGELVVNNFNLLPGETGQSVNVQIYHGSELVYDLRRDNPTANVNIVADKTANVLIDFTAHISITVELTGWGVRYGWIEYQ